MGSPLYELKEKGPRIKKKQKTEKNISQNASHRHYRLLHLSHCGQPPSQNSKVNPRIICNLLICREGLLQCEAGRQVGGRRRGGRRQGALPRSSRSSTAPSSAAAVWTPLTGWPTTSTSSAS